MYKKNKLISFLLAIVFMSYSIFTSTMLVHAESVNVNKIQESEAVVKASVTATSLMKDDFENSSNTNSLWTKSGGTWSVENDSSNSNNHVFHQANTSTEAIITAGDSSWTDYAVEMKIRQVDGNAYPGIITRYQDGNNYYYFQIDKTGKLVLSKKVNGTSTTLGSVSYTTTKNIWYTLKVVLEGSSIKCYVVDNGTDNLIFDMVDTTFISGKIGVRTKWGTVDFDDLSVASSAPSAPLEFTAEPTANTALLKWDAVEGATGYNIYRATNAAGPYTLVKSNVTDTTVRDTGLNSLTTYYYKITSIGDGGQSKLSDAINCTTAAPIPNTSEVISSSDVTDSTVSLSWNPVSEAKEYKIYRTETAGSNYTCIYTGTNTNFTDSGLVTGKTYYYSMSYITDVQDESLLSSEIEVTTVLVKPAVPIGIETKNVLDRSLTLNWNEVVGASSYLVYRADSSDGNYVLIGETSSHTFKDSNLEPQKNYYYAVSAKNAAGESEKSNEISVTTSPSSDRIKSGEFWYDNNGNKIQAHGGDMIKVGDTYYMIGEDKSHDKATFKNVAMYTSKDLTNWTFDKYILTPTSLGADGNSSTELASCKIERPKILYNEKTKKYVMWMHYENATDYGLARVAIATSDTIDGDYIYQGSFRPNNNDSRDMTVFKDDDGSAYLFSSSSVNKVMRSYKLTDDYLGIASELGMVYDGTTTSYREAPAIVKHDGIYYLITSAATGWYPNQAMYSTATSIEGSWSTPKNIGNSSTFYSQSAFIATIQGTEQTSYIMCSDRWVSSKLGDSTYVWMPLTLDGTSASMEYYDSYKIDANTGVITIPETSPLISQGKSATASNVANGSSAGNANDGNYNTNWITTGNSGNWPAWWKVDLGDRYELSNVQISWFLYKGSEAYYKYRIWVSDDDINYTLALDRMDNKTYGFTSDMLSGIKGRYVKIDMQSAVPFNNPTNNWYTPQLWEVKVFGNKSNDATLSNITLGGESLDGFTKEKTDYNVVLPADIKAVPAINATATDPDANVVITQAESLPGTATVTVTAADGTTVKKYTIELEPYSIPITEIVYPKTLEELHYLIEQAWIILQKYLEGLIGGGA